MLLRLYHVLSKHDQEKWDMADIIHTLAAKIKTQTSQVDLM